MTHPHPVLIEKGGKNKISDSDKIADFAPNDCTNALSYRCLFDFQVNTHIDVCIFGYQSPLVRSRSELNLSRDYMKILMQRVKNNPM